ncbi:MBL fold metallo-hydrolase [Nakamurella sp. YIM 132087]|uniref:MBL fold metallo-hydrolase n=1 Tax=Nakamurella alba TaxID=2665158 RepID=A0A7K1FGI3_9ACTN|nr:MBL fold metallo-hydrolase [Nakamurella alba]MTD12403.1 MBL fold metallo-hydrolase [Nakamurella alba]
MFPSLTTTALPAVDPIRMEFPGPSRRHSWAYLIVDAIGRAHLIDCGHDTPANREALIGALGEHGLALTDIATITGTHAHPDHIGMAAHLRRVSGARLALHHLEADTIRRRSTFGGPDLHATLRRWGVPVRVQTELLRTASREVMDGIDPGIDRLLEDDDRLEIPGRDLVVLSTPGHTRGHISVVDMTGGVAFVGDHVLPAQNPGVGLGGPGLTNAVEDHVLSLDRLASFDLRMLYPGHGRPIENPAERIRQIRSHICRRHGEVRGVALDEQTVWGIASKVSWSGGWETLTGIRLFSALQQVELHTQVRSLGARA